MKLAISWETQKLMRDYLNACNSTDFDCSSENFLSLISRLDKEQINNSLQPKSLRKRIKFLHVLLHNALLRDLLLTMKGEDNGFDHKKEINDRPGKVKFVLLTLAGVLVVASQGFDGIVTMLSVFSLSSPMILAIAVAFSFLSVLVFCGFDLVKISSALGVRLSETYKLLDAYSLKLEIIKSIRKKIDKYHLAEIVQDDLQELQKITLLLEKEFCSLTKASKKFDVALNGKSIRIAKTLIMGVSSLLFFGGGFFSGQSVAFFMSSLITNSVSATFWPVILFSSLVGLAAFSIYWHVERPGLIKLVSSWFGLDEDNILCKQKLIIKEKEKLESTKENIEGMLKITSQLRRLAEQVDAELSTEIPPSFGDRSKLPLRLSVSHHSFIKPGLTISSGYLDSDSTEIPGPGSEMLGQGLS